MRNIILNLISITVMTFTSTSLWAAQVDLNKSSLKWTGTKKLGDKHYGKLSFKSADWQESKNQFKKANFVVDMDSVTVDDLSGKWAKKFIDHIKSGDFFEIKKHPTAQLTIDTISKDSASGKLTVKGKTHPIKIKITQFKQGKGQKSYSGTMIFDRTKFGITYNSSNFFKNLVAKKVINNDVSVDFNIVVTD